MADLLDDLEAAAWSRTAPTATRSRPASPRGRSPLYYGSTRRPTASTSATCIGLLVLRRFQDAGHRPIALAGGATGMIGDPGGRSEERNLLDEATLAANVAAIKAQIAGSSTSTGRWHAGRQPRPGPSDVTPARLPPRRRQARHRQPDARPGVGEDPDGQRARHLLHRVQLHAPAGQRLLLLHEHDGCELQVGGSDQWGNILAGVDLIRRRSRRGGPRPGLAAADRAPTAPSSARPPAPASGSTPTDQPVPVLPVLDAAPTTPGRASSCCSSPCCRWTRSTRWWPPTRPSPGRRRPSAAWPARSPRWCTAPTRPRRGRGRPSALLFGGDPTPGHAEAAGRGGRRGARRCRSAPASLDAGVDLVDAPGARPAWPSSKGEARRPLDQGGVYVNGEVGDDGRPLDREPTCCTAGTLLLRKGKKAYGLVVAAEP